MLSNWIKGGCNGERMAKQVTKQVTWSFHSHNRGLSEPQVICCKKLLEKPLANYELACLHGQRCRVSEARGLIPGLLSPPYGKRKLNIQFQTRTRPFAGLPSIEETNQNLGRI